MNTIVVELAREARFRHVKFPARHGRGAPLNLAPRLPDGDDAVAVGLSPKMLAGALDGFRRRPPLNAPADAPLLPAEAQFIAWLFARCGVDRRSYRDETLRRRIPACLRALRVSSPAQARLRLEREPGLSATALGAILIGVTGFFRDTAVFEFLRREIIPALPRRAGHPRVWSVGCSDGQELYSVAMLLAEAGLVRGATLLGTDCRSTAVARARQGRYDAAALRDVPPNLVHQYFVNEGESWRVLDALRGSIQWRTADVTNMIEPGAWDMILCRNVSMYFRCEVAQQLRLMCERALRPGGVLVMGKAERPTAPTRLVPVAPCVYRKD